MQSPALNQKEYERKIDAVTKCGANRGPHDYMPIAWAHNDSEKAVTHLMCRVCFCRVEMELLFKHFPMLEI